MSTTNWNTPPRFDRSQFDGRRSKAVSRTTGIAFSDFGRMHVQRREKVQERRLPTPKWSVKDEWLRELLVVYLEERFYREPKKDATLLERLEGCRLAAVTYAPKKRELLDKMLRNYHRIATLEHSELSDEEAMTEWANINEDQPTWTAAAARANLADYDLHYLEIQIQNVDTDLVLTDKGHAEVIAAIVYLYYRLGWDSVTVAEQLGLKSPHVRIVLYRLHACWKKHLSHRERRKEEGQDAAANSQGAECSSSGTSSSTSFEPLSEIFGGGPA